MAFDLKARCKGNIDGKTCGRFLKLKAMASSEVAVVCPDRKCRAENKIKVVMLSDYVKQHDHQHSYNDKQK